MRRTGLLVAVVAILALLLGACSSKSSGPGASNSSASSPSGSSGAPAKQSMLAYSQCMRAHGLPDFPDPNSQGQIEIQQSSGGGSSSDLNPNSPTYQAAQKVCQKYVPGGSSTGDQSQQLAQALKYSKCMRAHGVKDFPDPKLVNGQIEFAGSGGVGRDPSFASANQACQSLMSGGGGS